MPLRRSQEDAPKVKWLNILGAQLLSINHAQGSCERNLSTHGYIFSLRRQQLKVKTLERYVRSVTRRSNARLRTRDFRSPERKTPVHACAADVQLWILALRSIYRNMRLRDAVVERGAKAKKESAKAPKDYPLSNENWSSCDESDEEDAGWAEVQATMGF